MCSGMRKQNNVLISLTQGEGMMVIAVRDIGRGIGKATAELRREALELASEE
jgi:C4-dicarboxylate-specific signal transduction histidine kinase